MSETNRVAAVLGSAQVLRDGKADVSRIRERTRRRRIARTLVYLMVIAGFFVYRYVVIHHPLVFHMPADASVWAPGVILVALLGGVVVIPMVIGSRSPHITVRPEHIEVGLDTIKGLDPQVDEVVRSINVFLGYATFREVLGGNPRRGILFEGPPGTGKTFMAKAMAKQAGVPFLFVSAPAFQSPFYGMTNVKVRSFFKELRKSARKNGGAIGFIEEIDAIGTARGGLHMSPARVGDRSVSPNGISEGSSGIVNELLIQMQSFDQPPFRQRFKESVLQWISTYLPEGRALKSGRPAYHNILLIAATNRADSLDPALLRPGRFDRRLYFDLPTKQLRRDLIDFFMDRKAHHIQLDEETVRDRLAQDTFGYSPVMIEHLFDEALLVALRSGRDGMSLTDIYEAKMNEEIGLRQVTSYTTEERAGVATHEAGHAAAAYILGTTRRLEVLSIIKRRNSLGLLAHTDLEEKFTKSRTELEAMLAISLGGLAAEELFFGESGTGPGSDLAYATELAAMMVGALGMGGSLLSYEAVDDGAINKKNLAGRVLSDPEAKLRVEGILHDQKQRILGVLNDNRDVVIALRDALVERDELVGEEIVQVIRDSLARRPSLAPAKV